MGLGEVLDDIKDNVTNIELENIATENIEINEVKINGQQFNINRFSKETLQKVNNMFNLFVIKNNIKDEPRLDRSVALEVFTMLPEVSNVEQAKLTTAPSIMNKEIVEKVFNSNLDGKLSLDVCEKLYEVQQHIEDALPKLDNILQYLVSFKTLVSAKAETLANNPPLVIECKYGCYSEDGENQNSNVNLYTEKLDTIVRLDDTKMEYPKYAEKLTSMYADVYHNETLRTLSESNLIYTSLAELSLQTFVTSVNALIDSVNRYKTDFESYISGLKSIDLKEVELNHDVINYINGHDGIAYGLEVIGKLNNVIETKDNVFDKAAELIAFID